jgi:hypothetical protein
VALPHHPQVGDDPAQRSCVKSSPRDHTSAPAVHRPHLSRVIHRCFGLRGMGLHVASTASAGTLVSRVRRGPSRDVAGTTPWSWGRDPRSPLSHEQQLSRTRTCSRCTSTSRNCSLFTAVCWPGDWTSKDIVSCCFATTPQSSSSFARGQAVCHS